MPAASHKLNTPPRTEAEALRDIAIEKARFLQFMTSDELQRLTDAELIELQDHAHEVITSLETDDTAYLNRNKVDRINNLRALRNMAYRELTRRAGNALAAAE